MIPILFESTETTFTSNGIGRLADCIVCEVTEERNGEFEVEFQYPINGIHYDEIEEGKIILVNHDEQKDAQPFVIYRRSAPINGVVSFFCHHISYRLSNIIVEPFTASNVADAFNTFTHTMNTNPFTFWTDNATAGTMRSEVPASVRSLLGGTEGSVLDVWGGEYQFDKFLVRNYAHRGSDKGVTIRYGKNLTNVVWEVDTMDLYGSVVPFWSDGESTVVYGGIVSGSAATERVTTLDLSNEFDEQPTVADLETRAASFLASNTPWIPKENIKIEFVPLWQTEEYADVAPLERVCLCDTVTVYYTDLGVQATAKVIKVVWDALLERYTKIELGQAQSSFADTIIGEVDTKLSEAIANVPTTSAVQAAIDNATELITGGLGGHICFLYDADGKPTDMLVMDTEDVSTAVHVLRINVNGIGFSSTGVSGTYTSAWTLDGAFVADFITSGYLSANRIQGGTLTLGGNNNGNGVIVVYNSSGTEIGRWDKDGLSATGNLAIVNNYASLNADNSYAFYPSGADVAYGKRNALQTYVQQTISSVNRKTKHAWLCDGESHVYNVANDYSRVIRCGQDPDATSPTTTNGSIYKEIIGNDGFQMYYKDYYDNWDTQIRFSSTVIQLGYMVSSPVFLGVANANSSGSYIGQFNVRAGVAQTVNVSIQASSSASASLNISPTVARINGNNIQFQGSSAKRYKHDITDQIDEELDAHKLYDLKMKQFVFSDDCESWEYPDLRGKTLPGFIAEDVEEIYPAAAIHDHEGTIQNWDVRRIVPGMLKLIQEQHDEIEDLKARLAKLEQIVEALTL